jgi:hypothetical protein
MKVRFTSVGDEFLQPLFFTSQSLHPRSVFLIFSVCEQKFHSDDEKTREPMAHGHNLAQKSQNSIINQTGEQLKNVLPLYSVATRNFLFIYIKFHFPCQDDYRHFLHFRTVI